MKIAFFFVIRKNTSSIEEKDLSNDIMNRVKKLKQQKTTVLLKFLIESAFSASLASMGLSGLVDFHVLLAFSYYQRVNGRHTSGRGGDRLYP